MRRQLVWVPPPGWPKPPAGWAPPPGWRADPGWPDAPAGWRFWQPARRTRAQRIRFGVLLGVPLGLMAALMTADTIDAIAGCGSIDPTDPANYSSVSIVNDTHAEIVLDRCVGTYCHADELPRRLVPGGSFDDDAGCGETGADMTSWAVLDQHGAVVGYIAVDSPKSTTGLVFRVSHASPNRSTPTPSG